MEARSIDDRPRAYPHVPGDYSRRARLRSGQRCHRALESPVRSRQATGCTVTRQPANRIRGQFEMLHSAATRSFSAQVVLALAVLAILGLELAGHREWILAFLPALFIVGVATSVLDIREIGLRRRRTL